MTKTAAVIVIAFELVTVLAGGPVQAGVLVETFDSLNPFWWTVHTSTGASVELVDGRLKCSIPNHSDPTAAAYIESTFILTGAFSVQVDYELTAGLLGTTAAAGIEAIDMMCKRAQAWEYSVGWHQYETIEASFHGNFSYHKVPGNMAGSLLLARNEALSAWGKYDIGGGWVEVYGYYSPNYGDGVLRIGLWGWPAGNGTTVYFDNLVVDHVSVPEPATLALLVLGGLTGFGHTSCHRRSCARSRRRFAGRQ